VAEALRGDDLDRRLDRAAYDLKIGDLVIRDAVSAGTSLTKMGRRPTMQDRAHGYGYVAKVTHRDNGSPFQALVEKTIAVATHYGQNLQPSPRQSGSKS
jgi:hypothetical protein